MYQKQFDALMTQTESEYIHLWEILSQFKKQSGNEDFKDFMEFQHRLGTQLRKIQIAYDQISKKEKDLIRRKTELNKNWFKKSLKKLHSMKNTLRCVSYIGRCLGDAFAYFFYQFDFETLDQHLRHEEVSNFPTRIGGVGELEIARRCRLIKDHFAIYHGITNMLRIGDFSLFNMKELKLTALAELKTERKNEKELSCSLVLIGVKERNPFGNLKIIEGPLEELASGSFNEARNRKQIRSMANAFPKKKHKTKPHLFYDDYHFKNIEELFRCSKRNHLNIKMVSAGLIYVCTFNHKSFKKRFDKEPDFQKGVEKFKQTMNELIVPDYQFNQLLPGSMLYDNEHKPRLGIGVPPLYWSFLSLNCLKAIYFHEITVATVLNPAHIFKKLEKKGFVIGLNNKIIELTRPGKFGLLKVPGKTLKFFLDQALYYAQTEEGIVDVICNFYEKVQDKKASHLTKFELQPRHLYRFRLEKDK